MSLLSHSKVKLIKERRCPNVIMEAWRGQSRSQQKPLILNFRETKIRICITTNQERIILDIKENPSEKEGL